ncbi:MAG: hypothetical protein Q8L98_02845 [Chlamydiales bacterium]|nr:hypothetical protein [Chlamydiales bacterium]
MSVSFTSTQKGAITSSRTLTDDQIQELANKATPLFVEYFQQPSYESLGRETYKNRLKEIVAPHTSPQRISSVVDVIFKFMEKSKEPNPIIINHRLNFVFKNPSLPSFILIIDNSFRLVEEQTFKMLEPNIDKTEQAKLAKVIENHLAGIKCSVENPAIHTENLNEEDKQKLPSACSALISLSSALDFQHHYRSLLDTKLEISFEGIKSHSSKQPMEVIKPPLHFLDPQIPEFVMKKIERFGILPILQPFFSKISSAYEGSIKREMTKLYPAIEGMDPDLLSAIRCFSPTRNVPNFKEYLLPSLPLSYSPPESFSPMIVWEEASMPVNFSNERRYWQCRIKIDSTNDSEGPPRKEAKISYSEKDED